MADEWCRDMRCVLNSLGECLAKVPEACQCKKMPRLVFEEARARCLGLSTPAPTAGQE